MQEVFTELARALQERMDIIGDEASRQNPEQHMARLKDVSERLEQIEGRLPPKIDPQLRHFLQRRSYSKALEHLTASSWERNQP